MASPDVVAHQARSAEGRGLSVRGGDQDKWIEIQMNTFMNWVNIQLQPLGMAVTSFTEDFDDGVRLCALVEQLQRKKIGKVIKKPINQHQCLENVTIALNAIAADNVRLVNIGSEDIVNGSLKLILGLIWHLILRYQIGKTKFPPKKLMLAWLKAVVPDHPISNFTSDWNDGVALHALIDYCKPGLYPNWRQLSRSDRLSNCRQAMEMAQEHFNIPMVVSPENLASPHLDELSGMTYLSYYMMSDSPGYHATLREVRKLLKHGSINNFTTDWNDGRLLCGLVKSLGVEVPGWPNLASSHVENLQKGIDAGRRLGVEPILSAKEMADAEVEHLGIMAYAATFTHHAPAKSFAEKAYIDGNFNTVYVSQEKNFRVSCDSDVNPKDVRVEVIGPDSIPPVRTNWSGSTANCSFVPSETGQHKLNVYCMGDLVSSCPVNFRVSSDRSKVKMLPVGRCAVGQVTNLKVDASAAGQGEIHMEARSPSGRLQTLPVMYRQGLYAADFTPSEVGEHKVSVNYDGEQINGSPFSVYAFDPSLVRVHGLEGGAVGKALGFHADCREAGDGNVRVKVMHDGSEIPSYISEESRGNHKINFTPHGAGLYKIHVFFEDTEIKGSPFTLDIVDSSMVTVSGEGLSLVPVNRAATFTVNTQGAGGGDIKVEVTSPSGNSLHTERSPVGSDLKVQYTPREVGDYTISVHYGDSEVSGSPFTAKAYDTSAITVTSLRDGFVGQPMEFTIDVSRAGEGQLQIMVNNGNLPNDVEMEGTGVYRIAFVPVEVGRQQVDISFNDEALPDSPFSCDALALTATVSSFTKHHALGSSHAFAIQSSSGSLAKPDVNVYSPDGEQLTTRLVPQSDGDYRVEWTPNTAGRHTVDVLFAGQQVEGSPFYIDVFDISKIKLDNFFHGNVGEQAGFHIDSTKAGTAERQMKILSPSNQNVSYHVEEQRPGEYAVTYYPKEAGRHSIYLSYGGLEIPGSPFKQEIGEATLPTAQGEGLYRGEEDKAASFIVDAHECSPGELDVQVDGSPFHPKIVDARKVKVVGGWQHYMDAQERIMMVVGEEKMIPFDISDAGPGKLTAVVKGPGGNVPVRVDDNTVGKSTVHFTPKEEGTHYIHLHWSEHPLDSSPFLGYAVSAHADPSKVILTGRGLKEATVREEAEFHIDGSQAGPGTPEVHLIGVRAEVSVIVVPEGGGRYRCTYIPVIPGAYLLHINWNGRQLRGSPYKVNVTAGFHPNKVVVTGEGLNAAMLGRDCDIFIDTRKAGPGELTAYCTGPSRVAYCELVDNHDGTFRLRIKPQETGKHLLHIRYGGENVHGSPFEIKVTAQPDASKVRVSGPGVEHGILATYQNRFIVETKGAGAGQLTVRIRGPKGAFQVEMYRDSHKDRTILCRYDPTECGLYIISVRWSGVDVPGSPFHVHIVDSQADLERILQSTAYGNSSINSGSRSYLGYQGSQYNGYSQTMLRDEI